MRFTKLHGLGNDFVVVDALTDAGLGAQVEAEAPRLCNRSTGVGSDGVLIAAPSSRADFEMIMVNPDGTRGMCGNGLRCFAHFLRLTGRTDADVITVDTPNGVTTARLFRTQDPLIGDVEVDMGPPRLTRAEIPMTGDPSAMVVDETLLVGDRALTITAVSMGNPHCVIFVDDPWAEDLETLGPAVERHEAFPNRTNVHVVRVVDAGRLALRVWERGAGVTQACGTGACAATVAGVLSGRSGSDVVVEMPGGNLSVRWPARDAHVLMRGPAEVAFTGEIDLG